jgi:hypothetical protein
VGLRRAFVQSAGDRLAVVRIIPESSALKAPVLYKITCPVRFFGIAA